MTLDKIRTGTGRKLRNEALQETALPIPYDAAAMPGATVLATNGQLYVSTKLNQTYTWKKLYASSARTLRYFIDEAPGFVDFVPVLQVEEVNTTAASISIISNTANNGLLPARLFMGCSRSSVIGGTTAMQTGDFLSTIGFVGADGANLVQGAAISAAVDGVVSEGDLPTQIRFRSKAQGATGSIFGRMILTSDGNLLINNTTGTERLSVTGNIQLTDTADSFKVGTNDVVGSRKTGWAAPTGTATRTTFDTTTVTTEQLAERVKALIDDLISHGLIGA